MSTFTIVGAGPVGTATSLRLAEQGHDVTILTRSGSGPVHPSIERVRIDAGDSTALTKATAGSTAILNCANPPYTSWDRNWPPIADSLLTAAESNGAKLVTMSNLYAYGSKHQTMTADTPLDAQGKKGLVRARMWQEAKSRHEAGRIRVAEIRASDFFGPEIVDASFGKRVVLRILAGKSVQLLGSTSIPHSFSYIVDVAATLCAVATADDGQEAWGRPWLVPSVTCTQREIVTALCVAADVSPVKIKTAPLLAIKGLGLFNPMMKELVEVNYQFAAPFVVDSSETTESFGIVGTALPVAARATIEWWRDRA